MVSSCCLFSVTVMTWVRLTGSFKLVRAFISLMFFSMFHMQGRL